MNSQEQADELLRLWQSLSELPPAERLQRIDIARREMPITQDNISLSELDNTLNLIATEALK